VGVTGFLLVASTLFGLAIGSFLNVVVYRVPIGVGLSHPPSACPGCETPIAPRDNIPLVSWLLLRGHCRGCGVGISARYPAVEATTAVLFVDMEKYLLPKRVVYPTLIASGLFLIVATVWGHQWDRLGVAALCGLVAFAVFFTLNFLNPRWLGFGDVRLTGVIGLVLGWLGLPYVLVGLLAANLAGIVVAGVLLGAGRMKRSTPMPYGVFLSAGAVLAVLAGEPLSHLLVAHPV
jgi:leader peptidase (prepilin peptidase)/N-methyltransferase